MELIDLAGFNLGFPVWPCLTKTLPLTSLTLPRTISDPNIWDIEGIVKEVPVENLKEKISLGWNLNDTFGSNEFSFLKSSYLKAALISKVCEIDLLSSPNKAAFDLALLREGRRWNSETEEYENYTYDYPVEKVRKQKIIDAFVNEYSVSWDVQ